MRTFEDMLKDSLKENSYVGELCNYIRDGISTKEKRQALLAVERTIKEIAGNEERHWFFKLFSEKEADELESLVSTRSMILNEMMLHTSDEMERFRYQNDKLFRLTQEAHRQERNMIKMFYHTPYREQDTMAYNLEKRLTFTWGDEDAVIKMANDEYYGSDFGYMLHLISELIERIPKDTNLINGFSPLYFGEENALEANAHMMDDGTTWADGYLHHEAFKDICICYAVHAVCTHLPYSIPDLLHMDDFNVSVTLEYSHEDCEQRERHMVEEEAEEKRKQQEFGNYPLQSHRWTKDMG